MSHSIDWKVVDSRVRATAAERGETKPSRAFVALALELVLSLTETEINDSLTDGSGDLGADAIYIADSASPVVHIFNCKYREREDRAVEQFFPAGEVTKILSLISRIMDDDGQAKSIMNEAVADKLAAVGRLFERGSVNFVIHLCSNGRPLQSTDREDFVRRLEPYKYIELSEVSLSELAAMLSRRQGARRVATMQASGYVHTDKSDGGLVKALVFTVTADEIVRLVSEPANKARVNWEVFDENLRGFLGLTNDVNDRVFRTASSDDCFKFWYLNNGISIVCRDFKFQPRKSNPVVSLTDPQIVNGCQTSNVLFEVSRIAPDRIGKIDVMVRVYATSDEAMRSEIALANNTQSRIRARDLRSNDPIQRKIVQVLRGYGLSYGRKRFASSLVMPEEHVEPLRLGQVILSVVLGQPDRAHTRSDAIFAEEYDEIFHDGLDFARVVPLLACMAAIERRRTETTSELRPRPKLPEGRSLAYTGFHILFAMDKLLEMEGQRYRPEFFDRVYTQALEAIAGVMKDLPALSNYEIFRNPRTKRRILDRIGAGQLRLPL